MKYSVYFPQAIGNGRYIVSELRSFLWFKWYRPLPDLYVEYDSLLSKKSNLKKELTIIEKDIEDELNYINTFVKASLASHREYSSTLSPKYRRSAIKFDSFEGDVFGIRSSTVKKVKPKGQGPPSVTEHYAADSVSSSSNNRKKGNDNQGGQSGKN